MKIYKLLDLRARKCFWNAPRTLFQYRGHLSRYGDFHYKDKTVSGIPMLARQHLFTETATVKLPYHLITTAPSKSKVSAPRGIRHSANYKVFSKFLKVYWSLINFESVDQTSFIKLANKIFKTFQHLVANLVWNNSHAFSVLPWKKIYHWIAS